MRDSESYYIQLFDKALPGGSSARGRAQLSRVPVGPRRRALSVRSPILFEKLLVTKDTGDFMKKVLLATWALRDR